jgi:hypothetical protein
VICNSPLEPSIEPTWRANRRKRCKAILHKD